MNTERISRATHFAPIVNRLTMAPKFTYSFARPHCCPSELMFDTMHLRR